MLSLGSDPSEDLSAESTTIPRLLREWKQLTPEETLRANPTGILKK